MKIDVSKETEETYKEIKAEWTETLRKELTDDHFMIFLLTLAKLVEVGKTLKCETSKSS